MCVVTVRVCVGVCVGGCQGVCARVRVGPRGNEWWGESDGKRRGARKEEQPEGIGERKGVCVCVLCVSQEVPGRCVVPRRVVLRLSARHGRGMGVGGKKRSGKPLCVWG